MSDQAEIITRPPSHPMATVLLGASILGIVGAISFVWIELFSEYMPAPAPGVQLTEWEQKHDPRVLAKSPAPVHDHYKMDFPNDQGDVLQIVEKDLKISSKIGDLTLPVDAGGGDSGGGESTPPPEQPPAEQPPAEQPPAEQPPGEGGG